MKEIFKVKKIILLLLCFSLFFQNTIDVFAIDDTAELVESQMSGKQDALLENELKEEIQEEIKIETSEEKGIVGDATLNDNEQLDDSRGLEEDYVLEGERDLSEQNLSKDLQALEENEEYELTEENLSKNGEVLYKENDEQKQNEQKTRILEKMTEKSEEEIEDDDPQFGREQGHSVASPLSDDGIMYSHNNRFKNYIIKDVIDVSYYQGDIDWGKVKESGIDYAIIRAGYRGYGEKGTLYTDVNFRANVEQANSAGIDVGVYFFSQAITEGEAIDEAQYVLELVSEYEISLPIVIDFEYASSSEGLVGRLYNANLSKESATEICKHFCEIVKKNGYEAMVYANKDMLQNGLDSAELSQKYKIWLANYTTNTLYPGEYEFWQYTQKGIVNGISTNVDKNFWYIKNDNIYLGIDYSSVYDFNYYINKYKDIKEAFGENKEAVLEHFVQHGMSEGRQGCEEFNVYTYRNRYSDLRGIFGNDLKKYYMHYITDGYKEERSGEGTSKVINPITVYSGVDYSAVYDFEYYTEKYEDIKKIFGDDEKAVLEHFVQHGMSEGRQGCEKFNVYTYRNRYSDLRGIFGNDLKKYYMHYITDGYKEERSGEGTSKVINPITVYSGVDYSAVYDFEYYTEKYEDIKKIFGDDEKAVLEHFVQHGMSEGRQGCEEFNVYTYRNRYSDLRGIFGNDLKKYYMHYITDGYKEERSGEGTSKVINPITVYSGVDYSAVYDFEYYTEKYEDIKKIFGDDEKAVLEHFVQYGMSEGRQGCENFDVYTYRSRYWDLKNAFGNNLKEYYVHFVKYGKTEGRDAENIGTITLCKIESGSKEKLTIKLSLELTNAIHAFDEYYIVQTDSYDGSIENSWKLETGTIGLTTVEIMIFGKDVVKVAVMDEFALAVKGQDGNIILSSQSIAISNPEAIAQNTAPIFKGTSKKGLQGIYYSNYEGGDDILEARNANTKQTLINLDLASVVTTNPNKAGYKPYTYKGNTYYFSELSALKANVRSLNIGYKQYLNGNNGTTPVVVTLCLLLSYNSENSFLIDPAARTPGRAYYTLNVREEYARETLEALFFYLGETFGQSDCYVSNWILGNEINSSKAWNYSGSLDFDTYMDCYATAFRMLYTGVKSEKTGNTVSISLDNGWTAAPDTYAGKTTLDTFAKKIHAQNPNIDWSIAYHPYSYPLTRVDFWNDYKNTADSLSTPYISMRNINVLTDYAGTLENTYGKKAGSIRVLLTEQGYSYSGGAENQAMAIARGYYIAEFNDRIDAFIIRAVVDDADEASGKLYFGLMNSQHEKRIAFYVYEFMDSSRSGFASQSSSIVSDENRSKFEAAKSIVCNTNWSSIVPGFDDSKLAAIK